MTLYCVCRTPLIRATASNFQCNGGCAASTANGSVVPSHSNDTAARRCPCPIATPVIQKATQTTKPDPNLNLSLHTLNLVYQTTPSSAIVSR